MRLAWYGAGHVGDAGDADGSGFHKLIGEETTIFRGAQEADRLQIAFGGTEGFYDPGARKRLYPAVAEQVG